MNLDTCVDEIKNVISKFATKIEKEKDERYEECRTNMEVIEMLPIVQFYKKRVTELTNELNYYKKIINNSKLQESITIDIEEKNCEDISDDNISTINIVKTNDIINEEEEEEEDEKDEKEEEEEEEEEEEGEGGQAANRRGQRRKRQLRAIRQLRDRHGRFTSAILVLGIRIISFVPFYFYL